VAKSIAREFAMALQVRLAVTAEVRPAMLRILVLRHERLYPVAFGSPQIHNINHTLNSTHAQAVGASGSLF
jgi:hypothetical protein